jgi:DNA-binding response OmpR family regulator
MTRLGAGGAAEALSALRRDPAPSLVILDLMLPDGDGYEICRWIRGLPSYVPIIMLSARDQMGDKVLGLEIGADDYVTKPFEPRELVARVRATLRLAAQRAGAPRGAARPDVAGHLRVWRAERRLEIAGQEVELTPREWALLELFLDHPRQVFGRETLLREIWGYDFLGDSRVVDVQIQRLRAKIERDPAEPRMVQTVRGFGYPIDPDDQRAARP